jgi:dTDP-4-amino-4,6-dideoxygalactose transaminase
MTGSIGSVCWRLRMTEQPRLPYGRQSLDEDDVRAVVEVLESDWLTTGPAVERFEREIALAAGTGCAVAVSSGTAALHCGYAALGIGPGAGIVTSPLTFAATATTALHLGAEVVFADVEPDSGNLDPAAVAELVGEDTRMVVATDYAGHPSDYASLRQVASEHACALMADAAHSFGARVDGRPTAQHVDAAALSFHPVKAITTGEGGAFVTSDRAHASAARAFRNHGIVRDRTRWRRPESAAHNYEIQSLGLNYRLPDVLCALGSSQLGKFAGFLARRRSIAARYSAAFAPLQSLELPASRANAEPAWHLYVLRVREASRRDALYSALKAAGLDVQVHYPPMYCHPLFEDLGHRSGECPVAEDYAARALSLPLYPAMRDADVDRVIDAVHAAVAAVL